MKETDIRPAAGVALRRRHGDSCRHGADGDAGRGKPDMLLSALSTFCGLESAPDALIIRNGLLGRDENGELTPLENL